MVGMIIRYQELSIPYRVVLWIRWVPIAYIKAMWWYFIKGLSWEDVGDECDKGRVSWDICVGINVGEAHHNMNYYYTFEEVFGKEFGKEENEDEESSENKRNVTGV